ncbi:MAG: NUDIX hydrolase [Candidatus Gracilibacteria bacterium]|nr:NUDIX hydrolase [Candidatus Gracilibacteria bacterium]
MENRSYFILTKVRGVILHEGKVYLCKGVSRNERGGFYCLPGGTLEPGETRHECMKRELIEELGVEPVIGSLIYTQEFVRPDGTTTFDFWYEIKNGADYLDVDISKCSHGFEHSEVGFYDENSKLDGIVRPEHIWELVRGWEKEPGEFVQNI